MATGEALKAEQSSGGKHVLDQLFAMGLDALANHYSIVLPTSVSQLAGCNDQLTFRITNVSMPDKTINTYPTTKRGLTFDIPSGNNEQSREVSFTFRPDKGLITYSALSAWMSVIQSNITMNMLSDSDGAPSGISKFRAPIEINAIDSISDPNITGTPVATWLLEGAFPTSLGGIEFDDTNGEPLSVSVTLNCFKIHYPIVSNATAT